VRENQINPQDSDRKIRTVDKCQGSDGNSEQEIGKNHKLNNTCPEAITTTR
jgi:hypothetical protein